MKFNSILALSLSSCVLLLSSILTQARENSTTPVQGWAPLHDEKACSSCSEEGEKVNPEFGGADFQSFLSKFGGILNDPDNLDISKLTEMARKLSASNPKDSVSEHTDSSNINTSSKSTGSRGMAVSDSTCCVPISDKAIREAIKAIPVQISNPLGFEYIKDDQNALRDFELEISKFHVTQKRFQPTARPPQTPAPYYPLTYSGNSSCSNKRNPCKNFFSERGCPSCAAFAIRKSFRAPLEKPQICQQVPYLKQAFGLSVGYQEICHPDYAYILFSMLATTAQKTQNNKQPAKTAIIPIRDEAHVRQLVYYEREAGESAANQFVKYMAIASDGIQDDDHADKAVIFCPKFPFAFADTSSRPFLIHHLVIQINNTFSELVMSFDRQAARLYRHRLSTSNGKMRTT
jgi:hypothetical protein